MNEKTDRHIIDILFVISLFALFVLSAVFLISIGAGIYSKTMYNMNANFDSRTAVAYINEKMEKAQGKKTASDITDDSIREFLRRNSNNEQEGEREYEGEFENIYNVD